MNPLKWVRWKVVIVLAVLFGSFYLLGLNPLARWQINKLGESGVAGARFGVEDVALGLFQGRSSFSSLFVATPHAADDRVGTADEVIFDLGVSDFLSRRFAVDELRVTRPLVTIQRREDGTINIEDLGSRGPPPESPEKPREKPTNWVSAAAEWMEKIRERLEERRKKEAGEKGEGREPGEPEVTGPEKKPGVRADGSRRVTYPFRENPRILVRKMSAEALEIRFEDRTGAQAPPSIQNGKIEIKNLSDRPEYREDPITLSISAEIEGGTIGIDAMIDLRNIDVGGGAPIQKSDLRLVVTARNIPLQRVVQVFAGDSLNATFEKGTVDVNAEIMLVDLKRLNIGSPAEDLPLFALHGVEMKSKPGARIAGFDGEKFCQAVNEVGDLEISDLSIDGTLLRPEFHWGDTIKDLVISGGKAFARKQADKAIEKESRKLQGRLEKEMEKNPELKKVLPGIDLEKTLKKGVGGVLDGILGGKKSRKEPDQK